MANHQEQTFEASLKELEQIVDHLEKGDVPLEEALSQFEKGIKLSTQLKNELKEADDRLNKIINEDDTELPFDEEGTQDQTNNGE